MKKIKLPETKLEGFKWYSPKKSPFIISGFAWFSKEKIFRRLPKKPKWKISEAVNLLANNSSGGQIKFKSNTKKLAIRVLLSENPFFYHMPLTGLGGFDCYIGKPGKQQHYFSTTLIELKDKYYESKMFDLKEGSMAEITLNFPLYCGVKEVLIGMLCFIPLSTFEKTSGLNNKVSFVLSSLLEFRI